MSSNRINYDELDKDVIPMVKYFNDNALTTIMSCSGHPGTEMKFFWIEFDSSVTEGRIIEFQKKHSINFFGFTSNGFFCKRFFLDRTDGTFNVFSSYRYFAHSVSDAMEDLAKWKLDDQKK